MLGMVPWRPDMITKRRQLSAEEELIRSGWLLIDTNEHTGWRTFYRILDTKPRKLPWLTLPDDNYFYVELMLSHMHQDQVRFYGYGNIRRTMPMSLRYAQVSPV